MKKVINIMKNFIGKYYKILLIVFGIIIIAVISIIIITNSNKIRPILKTIELGDSSIDLTNPYTFFSSKEGIGYCKIEHNIDINKVGTYKYRLVCDDVSNIYKVKVIDTTPPVFIPKKIAITPGTEVKEEDFFLYINDLSGYKLKFLTDFDINSGAYDVVIKVVDKYGNGGEVTNMLMVSEDAPVSTLVCDNLKKLGVPLSKYNVYLSKDDSIYNILRITDIDYDNDNYYYEDKDNYSKTNLISGLDGYAVFNDKDLKITMYKYISDIDYKDEFNIKYQPKNKSDILKVFNNSCK